MHVLDDHNYLKQHDPQAALAVAASEPEQLRAEATLENTPEQPIKMQNIVVAGMGGSALAAGMAKCWLDPEVPFEIVRRYEVPKYVSRHTLVIASSYSGNTEETLEAMAHAEERGATIAVIASGGKLLQIAQEKQYAYVQLPGHLQPRMAVLYNLKALCVLLQKMTSLVEDKVSELTQAADWLTEQVAQWTADSSFTQNPAKQLAEELVGKTAVIYAGSLMAPIAYKWKISFNENAKNVAFMNEIPEFSHNEFIGWASHPVEKPFGVIDLTSHFEHPRILKRFEITDRLLSGLRPKSHVVELQGETVLQQMLWGSVMADFVSIYLAILNGVNPTPVALIEKLKKELTK